MIIASFRAPSIEAITAVMKRFPMAGINISSSEMLVQLSNDRGDPLQRFQAIQYMMQSGWLEIGD